MTAFDTDVTLLAPESRRRRFLLVFAMAIIGLLFIRYGFATFQTLGWSGWPLALMLCVLAAGAWQIAIAVARPSHSVRTHTAGSAEDGSEEQPPKPDAPESP